MNRRVNTREEIKQYQETLSSASSKVDYSVGENINMLPSDIKSGTVAYNNKILVSDGNFSLGKNDKVNTFELAKISHKVVQQPSLIKTRNRLILTTRKKLP